MFRKATGYASAVRLAIIDVEREPQLRICHVIESASGGSAGIMEMLAVHALRRGHEVFIVYSPNRADERLIERLRSAGCQLRTSEMKRSVGPHDLRHGLALGAVLGSLGKLDVVHSHSSKAGALARTLGRTGAAQVYSPHGFYTMTGEAPFYVGLVERILGRVSDRVIAVSQYEADHGAAIGIPDDKLTVIPNGVEPYEPLSQDEARAKLGVPKHGFAVGFVGRLADQKDPQSAVKVIDLLPVEARVSLTLLGDGDLRAEVDRLAARARHPVHVPGSIPAAVLLSAFDCLLCTSRYEGMPVSFLEALNCGVPIVTYDVGGASELVGRPGTGRVTKHEPAAAARALAELMAMPEKDRRALSERCRATARRYSATRMGDSTLAVYQEVVRRRRS